MTPTYTELCFAHYSFVTGATQAPASYINIEQVLMQFLMCEALAPCLTTPLFLVQLSRDKKSLEEKLGETQAHLEAEEAKSKQEHRTRLKLESSLQDVEEKLDRETHVS